MSMSADAAMIPTLAHVSATPLESGDAALVAELRRQLAARDKVIAVLKAPNQ